MCVCVCLCKHPIIFDHGVPVCACESECVCVCLNGRLTGSLRVISYLLSLSFPSSFALRLSSLRRVTMTTVYVSNLRSSARKSLAASVTSVCVFFSVLRASPISLDGERLCLFAEILIVRVQSQFLGAIMRVETL